MNDLIPIAALDAALQRGGYTDNTIRAVLEVRPSNMDNMLAVRFAYADLARNGACNYATCFVKVNTRGELVASY